MLKLSVIMPVYNQEKHIADAVQSILNQTFEDFEFVIVDDGSTDRTIEIIESFRDSRIRLIRASHQGYVEALNQALLEARGKWLARMDSDDICPPDRLEKQMNFLAEHPECVLVTTSYGIVTPNDRFLSPEKTFNWLYVEESDITFAKRLFCDPATVFDRELALKVGYDKEIESESTLWYKLLKNGKGAIIGEPLYYIRWRMGSLSRGQLKTAGEIHYQVRKKYDKENLSKVKRNKSKKINLKNEKRTVYFSAAAGDFKSALQTAFETWRKFPLNIETLKLLLIALGLKRLKSVKGPCQVTFFPVSRPFELEKNQIIKNSDPWLNNPKTNKSRSLLISSIMILETLLLFEFFWV